jgi:hypothetical protein
VKMGVLTSVGTVLNERNRPLNIWGITYGAYVCG